MAAPPDPALVAARLASSHVEAAKVLAGVKAYNFASFHLLAALEELLKARFLYAGRAGLMGPPGSVVEVDAAALARAMFDHPFKIGMGILILVMQSPLFAEHKTAEEARKVKAKMLDDVKWLADVLTKAPGIREEAIYSGPDRKGRPPVPVDWGEFVRRVLPMAEKQVEFAEWIVQQPATAEDRKMLAEAIADMRKEMSQPDGAESDSAPKK